MEKTEKVRADLRLLRKIGHNIDVLIGVRQRHEARLEMLKRERRSIDEIRKIEAVIDGLQISQSIERATEIEEQYIRAINQLDPLDRTIILDGYLNGKSYWKIGASIGYSESGVKKRINKIIEQIALMI